MSADGRYDTPSHHLFRTLPTEHRDDFYQPCEPQIKANVGPRLPWQDVHAKIEGPAARDVMINFVERYANISPKELCCVGKNRESNLP